MKNFIVKNKKIFLIILITLLVIISFILIAIGILNKNNEQNEENENLTVNDIKNLIRNNYLSTYLLEGDIKVTDSYMNMGDDIYYIVQDPLLENINSISDISNLIENTFFESRAATIFEKLKDDKYNQYVVAGDYLYVKKGNVCENFPTITYGDIAQQELEDGIWIDYNDAGFKIKQEDGKWKTGTIIYKCPDETE